MGRITCSICKKRCRGDTLKVEQEYIHRECFVCSVCTIHLEGRVHCYSNGKLYCLEDYQRLYGTKCCACHKLIIGEAVTVFGNTYHQKCFQCQECGGSFASGDRAILWEGHHVCSNCWNIKQQQQQEQLEVKEVSPQDDLQSFPSNVSTCNADEKEESHDVPVNPRPVSSITTNTRQPLSQQGTPSSYRSKGYHFPLSQHWPLQYHVTSDSEGISSDSAFETAGRIELAMSPYSPARSVYPPFYSSSSETNSPHPHHSAVFNNVNGHYKKNRRRYQSVGPTEMSVSGSASRQGNDYGRFYIHNYLQLESDHDSSSTTSPKNRYRRITTLSGGLTPTPGTRSPVSPHFHRPPDRPFSYRNPSPLLLPSKQKVSAFQQFQVPQRRKVDGARESVDERDVGDENSLPPDSVSHTNGLSGSSRHPSREVDCPESVEPRRLSIFPGGHVPAPNEEAAIERSDWPAPPSPAVMMMERVRQKKFPNTCESWPSARSQSLQTGLYPANMKEVTSQQTGGVSFDTKFIHKEPHLTSLIDGRRIRCDSEKTERQERVLAEVASSNSGIAQALMKENQENEGRSPSPVLNPISSSRSPSASHEPELKQRYEIHSYASPSRDTRRDKTNSHYISSPMGYSCTGGRWTNTPSCPTTPKPGEEFRHSIIVQRRYPGNFDSSPNSRVTLPLHSTASEASILHQLQASLPGGGGGIGGERGGVLNWTYSREEVPADSSSSAYDVIDHRQRHATHRASSMATLSGRDSLTGPLSTDGDQTAAMLSVQNWLRPTSNTLWLYMSSYKSTLALPKIYPYQELVDKKNELRDVDPLKREEHLSEEEFQTVFNMSREIFKRLPLWKQMDLKRRASLA